jgi:hypothetical protein
MFTDICEHDTSKFKVKQMYWSPLECLQIFMKPRRYWVPGERTLHRPPPENRVSTIKLQYYIKSFGYGETSLWHSQNILTSHGKANWNSTLKVLQWIYPFVCMVTVVRILFYLLIFKHWMGYFGQTLFSSCYSIVSSGENFPRHTFCSI